MDEITQQIMYARRLSSNGWYSKSFDVYVSVFSRDASSKVLFEVEFRHVLARFNETLAAAGKAEDIFLNFEKATKLYPNNMYILNDIGKYLFRFGFHTEAMCHFHKALAVDSGFVEAEKNLNAMKNMLVERWHYRMLNDKVRNDAYRKAIHSLLEPFKDSVLDIGTGTGLLSIYANECVPVALTACDGSRAMIELAECIFEENRVDLVILVSKMSTLIDYKTIGGKRSLVLLEMFDAGLFGEHVLQTLSHAWEELISFNGRIVPGRAEFFVMGANCDQLNGKYQLRPFAKELLNISDLNVHLLTYGETYDCEDVHLFKCMKYITEPKSLFTVNFNSYDDIQDKLNKYEAYSVDLKAQDSGEINIVVGYFNLYLTDDIMLTTNPHAENRANAWQQAIFFDNIPINVEQNQSVNLDFLINEGRLTMLPTCRKYISRISPETLRFLNDTDYVNKITSSIGMVSLYLGQITEISDISLVDLCPFPLFGLLMLKREANALVCCAKTDDDKEFFEQVFEANGVPLSKVTILVGDDWSTNIFRDQKFQAIFANICELCGDISVRQKDLCWTLQRSHLAPGGLFLPSRVRLMGQLINSPWIDINNRVYDENVHGYKIAMHMNKYQVSQIFCVDASHLEYEALSEPVVIATYYNGFNSAEVSTTVTQTGDANAILCWFKIELIKDLGEITTNRADSFVDSMAFLAHPKVGVKQGKRTSIVRCVDSEGQLKLIIDDNTDMPFMC